MDVPSARGLPVLGAVPGMLSNPTATVLRMARAHQGVVRIPIPGPRLILVTSPTAAKHILQENHKNYTRGEALALIRPVFGQGLATSDGSHWLAHRRTMQPSFSRDKLAALGEVMLKETESWLAGLSHQTIDVQLEMKRVTLRIIVRTMFGGSLGPDEAKVQDALTVLEDYIGDWALVPVAPPLWLPLPQVRRFKKALAIVDKAIYTLVEQRRASGDLGSDLLGMLLSARDPETGDAFSAADLRDELVTIFIAGHETTANTLAWCLHQLSAEPRHIAAIKEEVAGPLTIERLMTFKYTRSVLSETLRLYPPAWIFVRVASEADEIDGYSISPKDNLLLSPYALHRDARYWTDPERFDPTRFSEDPAKHERAFTYFPFGGGPHLCIGKHFALLEATIILARLLSARSVHRQDLKAPRQVSKMTLGMKVGLPLRFSDAGLDQS